MKITKSASQISSLNQKKTLANAVCKFCPECGKQNSGFGIEKSWCDGFFKIKHMKIDCYRYSNCGCEWESDPYEYA